MKTNVKSKSVYVTVAGMEEFLGNEVFKIGDEFILERDFNNFLDVENVKVTKNGIQCGYLANSIDLVARGTHSAGYVNWIIEDKGKCKVLFVIDDLAIAEIIE